MIIQLCTPTYESWLGQFLTLSISGNFPVAKFDKFVEHYFRAKRWGWVDPMKDARSSEIAVKHGWKTDAQIADEYEGDFDDNIEEIKRLDAQKKGTSLEVINEKAKVTV
jgi:capsid protein